MRPLLSGHPRCGAHNSDPQGQYQNDQASRHHEQVLWLGDGRSIYDALGLEFTLLRLGSKMVEPTRVETAKALGVPLSIVDVAMKEARGSVSGRSRLDPGRTRSLAIQPRTQGMFCVGLPDTSTLISALGEKRADWAGTRRCKTGELCKFHALRPCRLRKQAMKLSSGSDLSKEVSALPRHLLSMSNIGRAEGHRSAGRLSQCCLEHLTVIVLRQGLHEHVGFWAFETGNIG